MKSIVYYTTNKLNEVIADLARDSILSSGLPIISCSLEPLNFGKNIVLDLKPSPATMFKQILAALDVSEDYVFLCEHDVIYHPSHFDLVPAEDKFYFNTNVWKWKWGTELCVWTDDLQQLSGMSGSRELLKKFFGERLRKAENGFDGHYEPKENTKNYMSVEPNIDIRHDKNTTRSKWAPEDFRNKKYAKGFKQANIKDIWKKPSGI